jgi:trimeric autotransporter adhesin
VVTVTQLAACTFAISPERRDVDAGGGEFDVSVSTAAGCSWTASSEAPWLTVRDGGNGSVRVSVGVNSGAARTGTATIAGRTLTVNQRAAQRCEYNVRPRDIKIDADAQIVRIEVRTASQCSWTAVVNDPWMRIVWGASGSGDGEVVVGVGENDGRQRKGSLTIAGETVEVEQRKQDHDE